jgi:serine/threonine-protein kinase
MIYSTADDGKLYAIRTKDGSTAWSYATGATGVISSSPTYQNGVIYFGSPDKNIYALNADGTLKWKYPTGNDVRSSPAISNNIVYCGSDDGKLYALNASTGSLLWSFAAGIDGEYSPTISNGKVFIQGAQNVYCLDGTSGAMVWNYLVPSPYDWSSPTELNGVLYVCGISNGLQTFNSATGVLGWSNQSFGQTSEGSPTIFGGVAYVAASGGLTAIDISSNTKLWNYGYLDPTSSTITSFYTSPVVYDTQTKTTGYPADSGNMQ